MSGSRRSAQPALIALAAISFGALAATWLPPDARAEGELNIYNWSDYIGENTVANFEKEYNVKVRYDTYDGNETLEAKLVAGNTGYDIVFPSSSFFARQIKSGIYMPLDRSKLTNWSNLDQWVLKNQAGYDPGNVYAVPYMWGTNGFTYNVDMVKERMPEAPVDSLRMIFDPEIVSKFQDCGVSFLDSPEDVIPLALAYMGKSPTSQNSGDIVAAIDMLMKVRPYIQLFDSQQYLNALHLLKPKSANWQVPVLLCSALQHQGIAEAWQAVCAYRQAMKASGEFDRKRRLQATDWMWTLVMDDLKGLFLRDPKVETLLPQLQSAVAEGVTTPGAAARRLLEAFKRH